MNIIDVCVVDGRDDRGEVGAGAGDEGRPRRGADAADGDDRFADERAASLERVEPNDVGVALLGR